MHALGCVYVCVYLCARVCFYQLTFLHNNDVTLSLNEERLVNASVDFNRTMDFDVDKIAYLNYQKHNTLSVTSSFIYTASDRNIDQRHGHPSQSG